MKKTLARLIFVLSIVLAVSAAETYSQTAYGISIVRRNEAIRIVDGYSGTWLDYYAGLYYDPEVMGDLYRTDDPETSLSSGRHVGYADIVPAEVYLATTNYVEGRTYCTYSQHFVWSYFYQTSNFWWFDPFRYSYFSGGGSPPFAGYTFSYYYVIPRRHRLGWTQACITIPNIPPPTPTPSPTATPTPTPTPTPCNGFSELSCSGFEIYIPAVAPVRPSGTSAAAGNATSTEVSVCSINPVLENVDASLKLVNRPEHSGTGGHVWSLHSGTRPLGKLQRTAGRTGPDGCFRTTYTSSHISGFVGLDGTILNRSTGVSILVRVEGLSPLGTGPDHILIGQTASHPDSHNAPGIVNTSLRQIAATYRSEFYPNGQIPEEDKVSYNDISLPQGGKFDLNRDWSNAGSHVEHREGINCDVRSNNIPVARWKRLNRIFRDYGSTRTLDETGTSAPHWHTRFEFGAPRVAERTPHSFVEDAFDGAFSRESTQSEYEIWFNRITLAKSQGPSELLTEAKLFQRDLFASSEYAARNRTQAEFVQDVYWTHLSREASASEIDYWVGFMTSLPPSVPANRRRARMLDEFHLLPEFEQFVLDLVDPTLSTF